MSLEVGNVLNGKVTSITNFGAFIKLEGGETGLCHISEISNDYVKSVSDFLEEGQDVKVKVISIDKGKVSLSIRKAQENSESDSKPPRPKKEFKKEFKKDFKSSGRDFKKNDGQRRPSKSFDQGASFQKREKRPENFEDMLSGYLKDSGEKLKGVKKNNKSRRGFNKR